VVPDGAHGLEACKRAEPPPALVVAWRLRHQEHGGRRLLLLLYLLLLWLLLRRRDVVGCGMPAAVCKRQLEAEAAVRRVARPLHRRDHLGPAGRLEMAPHLL
jgi:hypothetical protein